jgi:hypothetical protein
MDTPEFMQVSVKHIPLATMVKHNLEKLVHNGTVIMKLNKEIYMASNRRDVWHNSACD